MNHSYSMGFGTSNLRKQKEIEDFQLKSNFPDFSKKSPKIFDPENFPDGFSNVDSSGSTNSFLIILGALEN